MSSFCFVNYELFNGFDNYSSTASTPYHVRLNTDTNEPQVKIYKTKIMRSHVVPTKHLNNTVNETTNSTNTTDETTTNSTDPTYLKNNDQHHHKKSKKVRIKCPENEHPISIGTYEIPTQRDLVLFTKRTLLRQFRNYHKKTLYLLKDIKEATRSTLDMEKKCFRKAKYRKCVKDVSRTCIAITKDLVASLERQKAEVAALTEDRICNMTSMKTDPLQLIRILAMDDALSDFALPAFLRLLGACTSHCDAPTVRDRRPRLRHMTDQDLVVRHFLSNKNYLQLINDTKTYV